MFTMIKKTNDGWRKTATDVVWNDIVMDITETKQLWVAVNDETGAVERHHDALAPNDIIWAVKSTGLFNPTEHMEMATDRCIENVAFAMDAFWESIAAAYPEIKTGDFPFDLDVQFKMMAADMVTRWVELNQPETDGE